MQSLSSLLVHGGLLSLYHTLCWTVTVSNHMFDLKDNSRFRVAIVISVQIRQELVLCRLHSKRERKLDKEK